MATGNRTRVLIVDDSAVMRSLLRAVIAADPRLEISGTAGDGASGLAAIELNRPDVVLLDVEMPVMDGLATLKSLRQRGHQMPVIMCSSLTQRGAKVTIEALARGASDYVAKPSGQASRDQAQKALSRELLEKIHALTRPQPYRILTPAQGRAMSSIAISDSFTLAPASQTPPSVVVIGVSTGGPAALDQVLPALPASFPAPVLIVQHMPEVFTQMFAQRLNERCPMRVYEAAEGQPVQPGTIYVARGGWHMEVLEGRKPGPGATIHLHQNAPENHCRPAADVLFRSAARIFGGATLAVVLTGMGSDGLAGCRQIHELGGSVIAQDQASSTVWGMPGAVTHAGLASRVLPLGAIAPEIVRLVKRREQAVPSETRNLTRMAV